jgi:hypothetical protein
MGGGKMKTAQELADAHWSYIESLLKTHGQSDDNILQIIGWHYKTAFIHGFGHGEEQANGKSK